jgi:signal transduction histidine kinase
VYIPWHQSSHATNAAECASLLQSLSLFLAGHPEIESAPHRVTAQAAQEARAALTQAREALENGETLRKERRAARDTAEKALRKLLNGVIHEIRLALTADSPLWDSFGLTAPKPRARRATRKAASTARPHGVPAVVPMAA